MAEATLHARRAVNLWRAYARKFPPVAKACHLVPDPRLELEDIGGLDLEEEPRRELEEHVTKCPECRQNLYELRETLHSIPRELPENPPPAHLKKRIMEEITSAMAKEKK